MFQLGSHKALGPDGLPAFFYQEIWGIVKTDVINTVLAFFHSGSLFTPLNHTFITLILKIPFLDEVTHLRPISLCNVIYKIISKILAHEILDVLRKKKGRKTSFGMLKIDMSKAYDRVNWNFLRAVLTVTKFGDNWVRWVMECVSSVSYTLLVKGILHHHLSPYLFLFCANILSLIQAENLKQIHGVRVGRNGPSFTHLLFVDDSLLFLRKDAKSIENIKLILDWYCAISGQKLNLNKSDLFCSPNMHPDDQSALAQTLQVNLVQNPSKYLGMDFKLRGNRCADFQFLVDKLQSRLQGWKIRLLSQAGRSTLISSVLQALPLYTFACFKVPDTICNKMDSIVRSFWCEHEQGERNLHLIGWESVCQSKGDGRDWFEEIQNHESSNAS